MANKSSQNPKPSQVPAPDPLSGAGASSTLQHLNFRYPLRRYQQEILELVNAKLASGERQIHIVAPPGAGKTIIGLQLISTLKCNALILAPNTTIQSQWGQKLDSFIPPELEGFISLSEILGTHEDKPLKPITVLTYQVLSTPGKEQEYLEKLAHQNWAQEIAKGRKISGGEAELRILDLMQNNPNAYQREMSRHVSRLRKKLADVMDLNEVLHANAFKILQALRRQNFNLVLFDECHHLTDYWAAIMNLLIQYLDDPIVIGLTGTPPEGKSKSQENRYLSLVGEIDYQVPTPALVKEGGLAPFQDLVLFTQPTEKEFAFLESQHIDFHKLIAGLTGLEEPDLISSQELIDEAARIAMNAAEVDLSEFDDTAGLGEVQGPAFARNLQSAKPQALLQSLAKAAVASAPIVESSPAVESAEPQQLLLFDPQTVDFDQFEEDMPSGAIAGGDSNVLDITPPAVPANVEISAQTTVPILGQAPAASYAPEILLSDIPPIEPISALPPVGETLKAAETVEAILPPLTEWV